MTQEKLIDRIRKLLALANNNPNEAEASAAAAKVQELLQENGLEMAQIGAAGEEGGPKFDHEKTYSKNAAMYKYQQKLMEALSKNNFCMWWLRERFQADPRGKKMGHIEGRGYVHGRDVKVHQVLGRRINVQATLMTYDYLVETMDRRLPWTGMQKRGKEALQWLDGCTDRLVERLERLRRDAEAESRQKREEEKTRAKHPGAAPSDGRALVVLEEVYSSEADLNRDFEYNLEPGTTAKNRVENERKSKLRQAQIEELMQQGHPWEDAWDLVSYGKIQPRRTANSRPETAEEARKREARDRRWQEQANRSYWREQEKKSQPAYQMGRETGDQISLHKQVGGNQKKLGR